MKGKDEKFNSSKIYCAYLYILNPEILIKDITRSYTYIIQIQSMYILDRYKFSAILLNGYFSYTSYNALYAINSKHFRPLIKMVKGRNKGYIKCIQILKIDPFFIREMQKGNIFFLFMFGRNLKSALNMLKKPNS
jgi:hypothetical protein